MKVGKVISYDDVTGYIESDNIKYLFLDRDKNENIKVGDIVIFDDVLIHNIYRAYSIVRKKEL